MPDWLEYAKEVIPLGTTAKNRAYGSVAFGRQWIGKKHTV
jgi:hypothetical protein